MTILSFKGMVWLIITFFINSNMQVDFGKEKDTSWSAVNDGVMGGRSSGVVSYEDDLLRFTGSVSFKNNGGFASIRSPYMNRDMTDWTKVTIRYRCNGQSLGFSMEHFEQWYLPNYKMILPETNMQWEEITFNLKDFKEYRIGSPTGNLIDQSKLSRIIRLGFITNDKKEGSFKAEIDNIQFSK